MKDVRFSGELDCKVSNIGYISVVRNQDYTFEYKKGKEFYSFVYVENGELDYYFSGITEKIRIVKGSVLFIPKLLPYKTKYLKNNTKIKILTFNVNGTDTPFSLKAPIVKKSLEIFNVFTSFSNLNMNNALFLTAKVYELFYIMQSDNLHISTKYRKIIPAINEIKENYFENHKISYYADICKMSESNFRKLFKEYTGNSPVNYRNNIRIFEFKKMLDSGEFTVSEAAYLVGFNNMSFFYEVYNKYAQKNNRAN